MQLKNILLISFLMIQIGCDEARDFPIILQETPAQCGPVCLQMISKYYGRDIELEKLALFSGMDEEIGTSLAGVSEAADRIGLRHIGVKIPFTTLKQAPLPLIVHWNNNHFVVVYEITKNNVYVADPAIGKREYTKEEFCEHWLQSDLDKKNENEGVVLLLETTDRFYRKNKED